MRSSKRLTSFSLLSIFSLGALASPLAAPLRLAVDSTTGAYSVQLNGRVWYEGTPPFVCIAGSRTALTYASSTSTSGTDALGAWNGVETQWSAQSVPVRLTFKHYPQSPHIAVATASFPNGLDTSNCGANTNLSTSFPAFNTTSALAPSLNTLSWRGTALAITAASRGLAALGASGIDCGPVVSTDPSTGTSLVWSTLDAHKIVPQRTSNGTYEMGLSGALPRLPAGFSHSVLFSAVDGGATSAMYAWGETVRHYHGTTRLPSVTLTDIGYYTDDGAYYYVWEAFGVPPRQWPAEEGLIRVKESLVSSGVPIGYMQLDDWWYIGPFYFGNVKAVVEWDASNSSRLFPHGLNAFAERLDLPLQLYTPFWSDAYRTKYHMTESTKFRGTKLVTPADSYAFFADLFDHGNTITSRRFSTYEIDFLHDNFAGSASMFEDVTAAERWYSGMADAAAERNITIQYCLASATDMLMSLTLPAVVQARASGDYVSVESNAAQIGGSSLLMGATRVAPSKDTLWTASPQPPTYSDTQHRNYTTQPHVQLDAVLATLSLGPVGISDGLGQTDVSLIGQTYRSATDGTLLRPSRPLSTVDAAFANRSAGVAAADVRSTHAAVGATFVSHYVVAWRTTFAVTLQPTDLHPPPRNRHAALAVRRHIFAPAGDAQLAGCVHGARAVPSCVDVLPTGALPTLPPTGGALSNFSLSAVYEPLANGAYFLGTLDKLVHVSPQRFTSVATSSAAAGPCGLVVTVVGAHGEALRLVAVDATGVVRITAVSVPASGSVSVEI